MSIMANTAVQFVPRCRTLSATQLIELRRLYDLLADIAADESDVVRSPDGLPARLPLARFLSFDQRVRETLRTISTMLESAMGTDG